MKSIVFLTLFAGTSYLGASAQQETFLFRTPLSFYKTDILSYLQALHKNQQYERMVPFFTGQAVAGMSQHAIAEMLSNAPFGYGMKRAGIREIEPNQKWSITYSRTILGTQETFKVECALVRDTCRLVLDEKSKTTIFKQ